MRRNSILKFQKKKKEEQEEAKPRQRAGSHRPTRANFGSEDGAAAHVGASPADEREAACPATAAAAFYQHDADHACQSRRPAAVKVLHGRVRDAPLPVLWPAS